LLHQQNIRGISKTDSLHENAGASGSPLASESATGLPLALVRTAASPSAAVSYNILLPTDMEGETNAVFECRHEPTENSKIAPFDEKNTEMLIDCFIDEINEKYMAELAYPIPPGACELEGGDASDASGPHSHLKLVFVGGSHGLHVANLTVPGMRVTEASIEEASARLREELSKTDGMKAVVIYQIYDNNVFFAAGDDGSRMLPQRDPLDNKYHIPGRLEFADRNVMKNLVNIYQHPPSESWQRCQ
jgi:hypothetical protein